MKCSWCCQERKCFLGDFGLCEDCGVCSMCENKIYARVEYDMSCGKGKEIIHRVMCKDHVYSLRCKCGEFAKVLSVKEYTWIHEEELLDYETVVERQLLVSNI